MRGARERRLRRLRFGRLLWHRQRIHRSGDGEQYGHHAVLRDVRFQGHGRGAVLRLRRPGRHAQPLGRHRGLARRVLRIFFKILVI